MADFFISYTQADLDWATWIDFVLNQAGYKTVMQEYDFQGNFIDEMDKALITCTRVVLVLSPAYLKSNNCRREWTAAMATDKTGPANNILPVRVEEFDIPGLLAPAIYADLATARDRSDARRRLLAKVRPEGRPTAEPPFPGKAGKEPVFPGGRPGISNLAPPTPHFVGRQELLATLDQRLKSGAVALTALAGLGGIGKSQTALRYAHTRQGLDIAWWLRAEKLETMLADLGDLGDRLGVRIDGNDAQAKARAVLDALAQRDDWLLVYDNVVDEESVYPWLPPPGGAAIITSRSDHWTAIGKLDVDKLPEDDAVELLRQLSGDMDETAAQDLARDLDYLPLALEQAGAFAKAAGWSLAQYRTHFAQAHAKLLAKGKPVGYPATIATTWNISVERVEQENPAAAQLLTLCAFLAPDDIPLDLLRPAVDKLPAPLAEVLADPVATAEAIAVLKGQSLVKTRDGKLSLHRLLQLVQRHRLNEDERTDWARRALLLLRGVFRFDADDLATWAPAAALLPHAEAMGGWAEQAGGEWEATSWLLDRIGSVLAKDGLYGRGVEMRQRALALFEANLPADSPRLAASLNNLGSALYHAGQLQEALPLLQRALAIREAKLGPDYPDLAHSFGNLAVLQWKLGQLGQARPLAERALAIDEAHFGPDHSRVASRLDNLANILDDQGKVAEAEPLRCRALSIDTHHYGNHHPSVAIRRHNLAMTLAELGRLDEARNMMAQALSICSDLLGGEHPRTQLSRTLLAQIDSLIAQRDGGGAPSPHPSPTRGEGA